MARKTQSSCSRLAFEAHAAFTGCTSQTDVASELVSRIKDFGFEYVTVGTLPTPGKAPELLLNTRPDSYTRHYVERGYMGRDPPLLELRHTSSAFSWSDLKTHRRPPRDQLFIMEEASEWGMRDGLTIPIVTAGELAAVCPCGEKPDLEASARAAVQMIGITAYQTMRRLELDRIRQEQDDPRNLLSDREREVLHWVMAGKTDEEIGIILSISSKTVGKHVQHALQKYGVGSRMLAVVEGLRRKDLSL